MVGDFLGLKSKLRSETLKLLQNHSCQHSNIYRETVSALLQLCGDSVNPSKVTTPNNVRFYG